MDLDLLLFSACREDRPKNTAVHVLYTRNVDIFQKLCCALVPTTVPMMLPDKETVVEVMSMISMSHHSWLELCPQKGLRFQSLPQQWADVATMSMEMMPWQPCPKSCRERVVRGRNVAKLSLNR